MEMGMCGDRQSLHDTLSKYKSPNNSERGPRSGGLSGPWAVQHYNVACIHEYAS